MARPGRVAQDRSELVCRPSRPGLLDEVRVDADCRRCVHVPEATAYRPAWNIGREHPRRDVMMQSAQTHRARDAPPHSGPPLQRYRETSTSSSHVSMRWGSLWRRLVEHPSASGSPSLVGGQLPTREAPTLVSFAQQVRSVSPSAVTVTSPGLGTERRVAATRPCRGGRR
jgi:hypothetical protein